MSARFAHPVSLVFCSAEGRIRAGPFHVEVKKRFISDRHSDFAGVHCGCDVDLLVVSAEGGNWWKRNFIEHFGVGNAGSDSTAVDR